MNQPKIVLVLRLEVKLVGDFFSPSHQCILCIWLYAHTTKGQQESLSLDPFCLRLISFTIHFTK